MTVAGSLRPIISMAAVLFYLLGPSIILKTTTSVSALLVPPTHTVGISYHRAYRKTPSFRSRKLTYIHLSDPKAPPPLPDTSDPYLLLGLTTPTADQRQIKRAYKRMALQYHPDVRLTPNSTPEDKKAANDNFARINAAYAFLSGKSTANGKPGTTPPSTREQKTGASRRKTSSAYDPPHRRTGAPKDTSFSTNWEDYMPKNDEVYDTNGDSFSAIFNDFVVGSVSSASSSSSSSGGILSDFISFLEGNFGSSFGATEKGEDDSIEFTELLNNGSIEAIKNEMDDANLLTKQLEQKDLALNKEYEEILSQDSGGGRSYLEEMRLEECKGEIEARQKVVRNYLNKANARRIKLRKRFEDLRSSRDTSRSSRTTSDSVGGEPPPTSSSSENDQKKDTSWKRESFGSNGRRRRRGSGAGRSTSSSPSSSSSSEAYSSRSSRTGSTTASESPWNETRKRSSTGRTATSGNTSQSNSSTSASRTNENNGNIPPHRRLTAPYLSPDAEKRRLREIKVEEKIDEMKRELGL